MGITAAAIKQEAGWQHSDRVKFVLAADLGQSTDPTALCVLEHHTLERMHHKGRIQRLGEAFDVRHLQRLPLGLSYIDQVQHVAQLLARPPLHAGCDLIIDETGVGRAVGDIFENAGLHPTRVTITAGNDQSAGHGMGMGGGWHVAKSILISTLDARLHTGELRFAAELQEAGAMAEELKDFRRKVGVAGRYSFEARVGRHDDLVLAVALALWAIVGRPKQPAAIVSFYGRYGTEQLR
jgi:hypothetical protein